MRSSHRARREWRIFLWVSLASALLSAVFGNAIAPASTSIARAALVGVITSLIVATPILLVELKRWRSGFLRRLRRLPLAVFFVIKVAFYLVVIVGGLMLSRVVPALDRRSPGHRRGIPHLHRVLDRHVDRCQLRL